MFAELVRDWLFLVIAMTSLVLPSSACAAGHINGFAAEDATVTVSMSTEIGAVNRRSFGNNVLGYFQTDAQYSAKGAGVWDSARRRNRWCGWETVT